MKAQILSGAIMPLLNVITNLGFVVIATAGGSFAVGRHGHRGRHRELHQLLPAVYAPLNDIANLYSSIQSAQASAERIFELMDEKPEPADAPDAEPLENPGGCVEFEGVSFGYKPESSILKNVNLKADKGRTIALVGPTGAGKTTVVNLLVRFYDPTLGRILFDGRDMLHWTRSSLRASFGMVLQDTHLFSGTVRENIRYGRLDATDGEVEAAARHRGRGQVHPPPASGLRHRTRRKRRRLFAGPAPAPLDRPGNPGRTLPC